MAENETGNSSGSENLGNVANLGGHIAMASTIVKSDSEVARLKQLADEKSSSFAAAVGASIEEEEAKNAPKCQAEIKNIPESRREKARERWLSATRKVAIMSKFVDILSSRRETYLYTNDEGTVFWMVKLLFALPQFSLIPLTLLINVHIILFYNEIGVSLPFISFFQIFARSFDVLTDPMMAYISDNATKTRFGRRMPYLMMAPLYSFAFYLLIDPPEDPDAATLWFGWSYIFFYMADTLVNIPFQALGPELSDDPKSRDELYMWVKLAEAAGIMIGTAAPVVLVSFIGLSKRNAFRVIASVFGVWYILTMYALIYKVKERPASQTDTDVRQPFVTSIFRSFKNSAFRPLVMGWICDFASLALLMTMLPFFIIYYVGVYDPDEANSVLGLSMGCLFVSSTVSIPIWKYISSEERKSNAWYEKLKIGRVNAWLSYNVFNCVSNFMFVFIGQGDISYLYLCMVFNGAPFGGQFLISSMLADVIDYDEFLNFNRSEGQFSVFAQFIPKLIAIPCQSLPLVIIFLLGFRNPSEWNPDERNTNCSGSNEEKCQPFYHEQNESVRWFIRVVVVFIPLLLVSASFLIKRTFPIKDQKTMKKITDGITKHMQGQPATDPITGEEVWIDEMSDDELYLAYLLDHFRHDQLLWLLSPKSIYERHAESGMLPRKATLMHMTITERGLSGSGSDKENDEDEDDDFDIKDGHMNSEKQSLGTRDASQSVRSLRDRQGGWCGCLKSNDPSDASGDIATVQRKDNMKFGKNDKGEVVYVVMSDYEAHGIVRGTKRIEKEMLLLTFGAACCVIANAAGIGGTIQLLSSKDFAFVPAMFCLGLGLSMTLTGFEWLRYRAAGEIRTHIESKGLTEEQLARIIYPKSKGQRGGEAVDEVHQAQIDAFVPRETVGPGRLKSLTKIDVTKLGRQTSAPETDLYD